MNIIRNYTYSLRGNTHNQALIRNRGLNVILILAINRLNIIHPDAIIGVGVNNDTFRQFILTLKNVIGDEEEFVLVMNNVLFHHSTVNNFYDCSFNFKLLSRYSPLLNPCEIVLTKIRNSVRG